MVNKHILGEVTDRQITDAVVELETLATGKTTRKWPVSKSIVANRRQDLLNELYQRWCFDCEVSDPDDRPEIPQILKGWV